MIKDRIKKMKRIKSSYISKLKIIVVIMKPFTALASQHLNNKKNPKQPIS